ncbi:hypothetical protein INR49_019967, partial [Caranx melampygus]
PDFRKSQGLVQSRPISVPPPGYKDRDQTVCGPVGLMLEFDSGENKPDETVCVQKPGSSSEPLRGPGLLGAGSHPAGRLVVLLVSDLLIKRSSRGLRLTAPELMVKVEVCRCERSAARGLKVPQGKVNRKQRDCQR